MCIDLDISLSSELDFADAAKAAVKHTDPLIWRLNYGDFKLSSLPTYVQALEYFEKSLYVLFPKTQAIILYEGSADEDLSMMIDQLIAALPDDIEGIVKFDIQSSIAKSALLTPPERYPWAKIETSPQLGNPESAFGILFPIEEICTPEILNEFDLLFAKYPDSRIVYEYNFTETWDGLDEVIILPHTLSKLGKRKLQGFFAAGGQVLEGKFGVEGFEPPTFWSQTRRASQAALYPE